MMKTSHGEKIRKLQENQIKNLYKTKLQYRRVMAKFQKNI